MKTYLTTALAAWVGALIAGAVVYGLTREVPDKSAKPSPDVVVIPQAETANDYQGNEERLDKLESAILALTEQVIELKADIAEVSGNHQGKATEAGGETKLRQPELSREEKRALKEAQLQELEYLATNREGTHIDWSIPMTQTIVDRIATTPALKVATTSSAQCGDNICKVSAILPANLDVSEKDVFVWSLLMSLGEELPTATGSSVNQQDGSTLVTYYFSRAGFSLPQGDK